MSCFVPEVTDRRVSEVSAAGAAGSVGGLGGHAVGSARRKPAGGKMRMDLSLAGSTGKIDLDVKEITFPHRDRQGALIHVLILALTVD